VANDATGQRRCIGSAKFGIEAHEAPIGDFPIQPSQKDGLGRMCKPHWNQYTNALRKAALARKAAEGEAAEPEPVAEPIKKRTKRAPKAVTPEAGAQGDAGMAVDHEAGAPVDEDLLDPADRVERAGERVLLRLRVDPPVGRVREELVGRLLAGRGDSVAPARRDGLRGHAAAAVVRPCIAATTA